jgi:hypothetical protein
VEFVAARRDIGGDLLTGEQRDRMDQTVAAEELAEEGQWFWNEPNPVQSHAAFSLVVLGIWLVGSVDDGGHFGKLGHTRDPVMSWGFPGQTWLFTR